MNDNNVFRPRDFCDLANWGWLPASIDRELVSRACVAMRRIFSADAIAAMEIDSKARSHPIAWESIWRVSALRILELGVALDELPRVRKQLEDLRENKKYAPTRGELWAGLFLQRGGASVEYEPAEKKSDPRPDWVATWPNGQRLAVEAKYLTTQARIASDPFAPAAIESELNRIRRDVWKSAKQIDEARLPGIVFLDAFEGYPAYDALDLFQAELPNAQWAQNVAGVGLRLSESFTDASVPYSWLVLIPGPRHREIPINFWDAFVECSRGHLHFEPLRPLAEEHVCSRVGGVYTGLPLLHGERELRGR